MPNIKTNCDCGRVIERDPSTNRALRKCGSNPVCLTCYRRQHAYELYTVPRYRRPGPGPTVLGGLPYATLGKP
jgi:hypothetical protein